MTTASLSTASANGTIAPSAKHLAALDGLRGLAILEVLLHHYGYSGTHHNLLVARIVATLCGLGWSGVDLFFVLSGFLITGILIDSRGDSAYYQKFYARRALRIFPIYYLFALLIVLLLPIGVWHLGDLAFLVYLGYPSAVIWPTLVDLPVRITHLWSLSAEEQFYMLWPWLLRRLKSPLKMLAFCGLAAIGALAARIAWPTWAYATLPCRIDALCVGAALAVVRRSAWRERCERYAARVFWACAVLTALTCVVRGTTAHNDRLMSTGGFSVIAVGYGALLVLSLGPLRKLFSLGALCTFGKYSYGIYLYHFPLMAVFERLRPTTNRFPFGPLAYVLFCLAANLGIAALSFHVIEKPILKFKKRFEY